MKTMHRVEATEDYLKEAQRLVLSQNKTLRLMYLNRGLWWSSLLALVAAVIFLAAACWRHRRTSPSMQI
jgi:hypothetical protein